jgi:hypothetical protein
MRYEDGQPEHSHTVADIYAAWIVVLAFIFGFVMSSLI